MSDSDDGYSYSDLEYSSEDDGGNDADAGLVEIENTFYDADDYCSSNPTKAAEMYKKVVELETARGSEVKYRFKALLKLVQLQFKLQDHTSMVARYEELLSYMESVTSNELQDAIQSVLDTVSASTEVGMLSRVYEVTLQALKAARNERLWFSTLCKKGRLLVLARDWAALTPLVKELHATCKLPNGQDDPAQGNHLMEVYALDIQLATAQEDRRRMKTIYERVMALNAAVSDPRVTGVVRQSFGVMRMNERKWEAAYDEFYAAFKSYQEAGSQEARTCLKYLVLANILSSSTIDPFDSQEALVYKDDKEVSAMAELRTAYQRMDIKTFQSVLRDRRNHIADDQVIAPVVSDLLRGVRSHVILRTVRPYSAIRMEFLARHLTITVAEVEDLVVQLVHDGRLNGRIDQINGVLHLPKGSASSHGMDEKALGAIERWAEQLGKIRKQIGKQH